VRWWIPTTCISTNCSGGELIDNRVNGIIIPIGNCRALKDAMTGYIDNSEKRELMAIGKKVDFRI